MYSVGVVVFVPVIVLLCRRWYRAGALRWLVCTCFSGACVAVALTLVFSLRDWGLHLHHYFVGLLGYLGARGNSWLAAMTRALFLGAFINGLCLWGDPLHIPIWNEGRGWYPPKGSIDSGPAGAGGGYRVLWTSVEVQNGTREASLSWAVLRDLRRSCSLPTLPDEDGEIFVVEMNHVEVYRGRSRAQTFRLPEVRGGNAEDVNAERGYFYFRVGTVNQGMSQGVFSASKVLAVRAAYPPVAKYYNPTSADACDRALVLHNQPKETLDGYI